MKRFPFLIFAVYLTFCAARDIDVAAARETVVLTMGSWRSEDAPRMNRILDRFHALHPAIDITFDPTTPSEYDAALRSQLEDGGGPDLFYLRSYSVGRRLFDAGHVAPLNDMASLKERFRPAMREPWSTEDGVPYGVPFIATSHGVYYNIDIFERLGLNVPASWSAFLETAQSIKKAGVTPFANASGDPWTINEIVLMNLIPNFIGGREGRKAYLSGERCFNDDRMTAAFAALEDLAPYFPKNHPFFMYADSLQLFVQGKAAMWMGGSWDIPFFESENPPFQWSVFAVPPPKGSGAYITFHLDAGMGLNAHSTHKAEARQFLEWMTTPEFAALMGNELPGFFPMHTDVPRLDNAHANAFLGLNADRGADVRFAWEAIRDGSPDAYSLMQRAALAVLNGEETPRRAADSLQAGLAQWYPPAQTCGRTR